MLLKYDLPTDQPVLITMNFFRKLHRWFPSFVRCKSDPAPLHTLLICISTTHSLWNPKRNKSNNHLELVKNLPLSSLLNFHSNFIVNCWCKKNSIIMSHRKTSPIWHRWNAFVEIQFANPKNSSPSPCRLNFFIISITFHNKNYSVEFSVASENSPSTSDFAFNLIYFCSICTIKTYILRFWKTVTSKDLKPSVTLFFF